LSFLGLTPQTSAPPEALQGFIDSELVSWGKVVKSAGLAGRNDRAIHSMIRKSGYRFSEKITLKEHAKPNGDST
jgi:hypothetical protein